VVKPLVLQANVLGSKPEGHPLGFLVCSGWGYVHHPPLCPPEAVRPLELHQVVTV